MTAVLKSMPKQLSMAMKAMREAKRPLKAPRHAGRSNAEFKLQQACVEVLAKHADPRVVFWASLNGIKVKARDFAVYKNIGARNGVADLHLDLPWLPGRAYIEFKTVKGKSSSTQLSFQRSVEANGARYAIIRSLDQFIDVMEDWRIFTPEAAVEARGPLLHAWEKRGIAA